MKVLITGTSSGVGKASALKFLSMGYEVVGIDIKPSTIDHTMYKHFIADVSKAEQLPNIVDIDIKLVIFTCLPERLFPDHAARHYMPYGDIGHAAALARFQPEQTEAKPK